MMITWGRGREIIYTECRCGGVELYKAGTVLSYADNPSRERFGLLQNWCELTARKGCL